MDEGWVNKGKECYFTGFLFSAYCLAYMGFFMGRSEMPNVLLWEVAGRPEVYTFPASAGTSSGNTTVN